MSRPYPRRLGRSGPVLVAALLAGGLLGGPARAADTPSPAPASAVAARLAADQADQAATAAEAAGLRGEPPPAGALGQLRVQVRVADAEFRGREAVRDEQAIVYVLAGAPALEAEVLQALGAGHADAVPEVVAGLRALWRSAGITDPAHVAVRHQRRYQDSEPLPTLLEHYHSAAGAERLDWTYLAAINFIESDFGRSLGPSSAGAAGPMQFLPGTWQDFGNGGDIMSPRDSIAAAARFLAARGAPASYDRALFRYNNDDDYVAAVTHLATAIRTDPTWLTRLYYWSTTA